ncbi:cobalamin-binding protein [Bacillus xiapuensis]|uniref:cobalamin-binding protein n=1 Tax=Bacillus xiapuensis TaxID=2014075 RepID=UPI000C24E127|nr:cobalamin-binding protein [Bacillus xiapuensis]
MRLISICPSNTEILAYLGLTDQLVGVDNYSDWPQKVKTLPQLGPDLKIDMDQVEKLQPDLVIASLSVPGMERNIEELKKRRIPFIVTNPQSLTDIGHSLLEVGKQCGASAQAEKMASRYFAQLKLLQQATSKLTSRPSLYWEWWPKPVFTPGKVNWLTEISEIAGARNVFSDQETASYQTNWEEIRIRKPDYIFLAWVGVQTEKIQPAVVNKRPGWAELPAIQNGRVAVMEEYLYCRPSPRVLAGLDKLVKMIHPAVGKSIELDPVFA